MCQESPEYLKELIRKTRTLTDKPFGVGVVLAFPQKENIKAILEEKVAVLQLYWGECSKELVHEAHNAGVKVVPQVSVKFLLFVAYANMLDLFVRIVNFNQKKKKAESTIHH